MSNRLVLPDALREKLRAENVPYLDALFWGMVTGTGAVMLGYQSGPGQSIVFFAGFICGYAATAMISLPHLLEDMRKDANVRYSDLFARTPFSLVVGIGAVPCMLGLLRIFPLPDDADLHPVLYVAFALGFFLHRWLHGLVYSSTVWAILQRRGRS